MELAPLFQMAAFGLLALISVGGALGMATTMSMFRSGIFLMASFLGVAGLFILLLADLIGLLQVMMYIGGMLVMILFMVLFSHDPGGRMMTGMMELPRLERFFSAGLAGPSQGGNGREASGNDHPGSGGMEMESMSMFTPVKRPAAGLAILIGTLLSSLILIRPSWADSTALPDPDSAERIGHLLMGKYMLAFEGAAMLILLGIFGAVMVSRPGRHPDPADRARIRAAVDAPPAPIDASEIEPRRVRVKKPSWRRTA